MDREIEVKICGLRRLEDALAAVELGADYLGFVLFKGSPRCIAPSRLAELVAGLPAGTRCVGVFVNAPAAEVARVVAACGLHAAQIHGDEPAAEFAGAGFRVWRALHVAGAACCPDPDDWPRAERFVLDAAPPGVYGGSGTVADWQLAARLARERRTILAGGLTPDTVAAAVRRVRPLGVDVSSGVEQAPGIKDRAKMAAFLAAARGAAEGCAK